jgi:hypothetical protein
MYASVGAVVRLMLSAGAYLHHGSKVGVQQGSGRGWGLWPGQKVSLPCLIHLDPLLQMRFHLRPPQRATRRFRWKSPGLSHVMFIFCGGRA